MWPERYYVDIAVVAREFHVVGDDYWSVMPGRAGLAGSRRDYRNGCNRGQKWDQDSRDVEGAAETYDGFGQALGWGDFNKDGYADLAVGAPGETIGITDAAGA